MYNKVITLTEFILKEERKFKKATGSFTLLLTQIENASKIIASHIKKTGLVDIIGQTGEKNIYQEEVQKLDRFSNDLLVDMIAGSGQAYAVASEEIAKPVFVKKFAGKYTIFFDPLDGSSNINVGITTGTIFSIYHKNGNLKLPGYKQVAAGYIVYGTSVIFVYTAGNGVNGFTLDPSIGTFLLSHPNIKIPDKGRIYSINEGYWDLYDQKLKNYLLSLKKEEKSYKTRYAACMVADVHRVLIQGGIFLYPSDNKHPEGKLRLMFEVNPMSLIIKQAGGLAISNGKDPLKIIPSTLDQRVPIVMGSREEIKKYLKFQR